MGLLAGVATLAAGVAPSQAAYGDAANVFGKITNKSGARLLQRPQTSLSFLSLQYYVSTALQSVRQRRMQLALGLDLLLLSLLLCSLLPQLSLPTSLCRSIVLLILYRFPKPVIAVECRRLCAICGRGLCSVAAQQVEPIQGDRLSRSGTQVRIAWINITVLTQCYSML